MTEDRYKRPPNFGTVRFWVCTDCGGAVADREIHDAFHSRVVEDPWVGFDPSALRVTEAVMGAGRRSVMVTHLPTGVSADGEGATVYEARKASRNALDRRLAAREKAS